MRNTLQKPANAEAPISLHSNNVYPPQGTASRTAYPGPRYQEQSREYAAPPQHADHRQFVGQGDPRRPDPIEDDRAQIFGGPSPLDSQQKPKFAKQQLRPFSRNSHMTKYQNEGFMHPPASLPRRNSLAPQNPGAAAPYPASLRGSPQRNRNDQETEREKMLRGHDYLPLTPALITDREKCIAAIWRFNNTTNPSHGASPEERTCFFRQILALRPDPEPPLSSGEVPRPQMEMPFGGCGERVVVEAPFHCDYGYNITVGDDVLIGADCRISDTCTVTIGHRCIISPGVKIVCATYPIDARRRKGSNGTALSRNVVIEEDCWIGSNVTILAGVRVGKSSTVVAGSLLHLVRLVLQPISFHLGG